MKRNTNPTSVEESPGFAAPLSQQARVSMFQNDAIGTSFQNNMSSQQFSLAGNRENRYIDAIDIHPDDTTTEEDAYRPPESALYSSKKTKRSGGVFPVSPSATPRYGGGGGGGGAGGRQQGGQQSLSNCDSSSSRIAHHHHHQQLPTTEFSTFSSSSVAPRTSWRAVVDKSLALSSVSGGQLHRALAESPSSASKTSGSTAPWSGRGSSGGGRGGNKRSAGSWLDRNRTRIRGGKFGSLAQQLLDMQDDVDRKVEQLKAMEFQKTHQSSSTSKKIFVPRSDPRTGRFIEVKVCEIDKFKTHFFVARCERFKDVSHEGDRAGEVDPSSTTTLEVDLVMSSKLATSIDVETGCVLRLYEPWMELSARTRQQHNRWFSPSDTAVQRNLLVVSALVTKV